MDLLSKLGLGKLSLALKFKAVYDAFTNKKGTAMSKYSAAKTATEGMIQFLVGTFPVLFAGTGLGNIILPDSLEGMTGNVVSGLLAALLQAGWFAFKNWQKNKDKGKTTTSTT